jgi:hypothetical protein
MPHLNATPSPSSQAEIDAARAALVAIERECLAREAICERHGDWDFIDQRNGHLLHDPLDCCPWCRERDCRRAYLAALRSTVIQSCHTIKPKRLSRERVKAHRRERARLQSIHDNLGDQPISAMVIDPLSGEWCTDPELWKISASIEARTNELGEVEPGAKTAAHRIEIAVEIERLSYVADAHDMKLLEIKQRRRLKDAEIAALRASLKLR